LINELQEKYDMIFKSCNIKVQNNISNDIFVKTERSRLLEVLDHVSSNAVNSMIEGGTLTFEAREVEEKTGSFIDIAIRDTGVGLEREQTDHLFDEFYKVDDSRHKLDSTGLGLAICRRIIEKHGGKIWADSHGKGTGATIHFTIPSA
jgi:signal transduction histidine kinase